MKIRYVLLLTMIVFFPASSAFSITTIDVPEGVQIGEIASVVMDKSALDAGLSVIYYPDFMKRHLRFLPKKGSQKNPGVKGRPIEVINHQFGKGEVFDSGSSRGVGLRAEGYLLLKAKGQYRFRFLSNDGAALYLGEKLLVADPAQHSDRLSGTGEVTILTPGYIPVRVEYFQRKGTAAFKLLYQEPGKSSFEVVPALVYHHLRE